ncbi:inositol monophosphatase [candidate division KSB1 bacterium]|nr:inositol monophosphatase [candidate division KSB1 bacterium]
MTTFLETAIEAARLGGKILMESLSDLETKQVQRKQEFDFVTQVDHRSEEAILKLIRERHPGHSILAEESGGSKEEQDYLWIIDPLDGTKNYIHGFPVFAVSVALQFKSELRVGVVFDPVRDELFHAEKDKGAFLNDDPIKVSETTDFSECLLATGFPFRAKHLTEPYLDTFKELFYQVSDFRRAGAAAIDLAYVACGRLDGFWELMLNSWDIAAGALLIEEAGGKVTDIWRGDSHLKTGHIVASNGLIHEQITAATSNKFSSLMNE